MSGRTVDKDNGILSSIPGAYVGAALKTLSESSSDECQATVIDVPDLGPIRFTCQRHVARRGKSVHRFWVAIKAELVK